MRRYNVRLRNAEQLGGGETVTAGAGERLLDQAGLVLTQRGLEAGVGRGEVGRRCRGLCCSACRRLRGCNALVLDAAAGTAAGRPRASGAAAQPTQRVRSRCAAGGCCRAMGSRACARARRARRLRRATPHRRRHSARKRAISGSSSAMRSRNGGSSSVTVLMRYSRSRRKCLRRLQPRGRNASRPRRARRS